ncbi:MAG: hypothetical protein FJY29_11110 [Betaproteobacteria bacterium]|nr:hypothetical protein [Betaproteobacteria bacterium]
MKSLAHKQALLWALCLLVSIHAHVARALCKSENEGSLNSEIALANMIIYSQEYMKYFFADDDSDVQPLPASGMSLFLSREFTKEKRWLTALTLPIREEEVFIKNAENFKYYYPKLAMVGLETDLHTSKPLTESSCFRISAAAGLALPLSKRISSYAPPFLLSRMGAEISKDVFLNFGMGYSGNIKTGAWFFPFGVSYIIR